MMTRDWNRGRQARLLVQTAIIMSAIALVASESWASDDKNSIQITSVQVYMARYIATGEYAGHFFHVNGQVNVSNELWVRLKTARDVPVSLTARMEVNGKQFSQCGVGGTLDQLSLTLSSFSGGSQHSGMPISPLFYVPDGAVNGAESVSLSIAVERDDAGFLGSPMAWTPVPWTKAFLASADVVRADWISTESKESPDKATSRDTGSIAVVKLRLPPHLIRVLGGGKSSVHCGTEVAEDLLSIGSSPDILVTRFASTVDALKCSWEIRFPDVGVKLDLQVQGP